MDMADTDRAQATRRNWLETLDRHRRDFEQPGSAEYWSPSLDCASRDELRAIQDEKLAALTPFLYENSLFDRRRFDKLGLTPGDIRSVDDLVKWPPVDKKEMSEDLMANPPWGTYTTHDDEVWKERGWTLFPTSGTTGLPRVFRYSKLDLKQWQWANARALWSLGARTGELVFLVGGFGPHVWAWGVLHALAHMGVPCIPGGGLTAEARCNIILRYRPTVLATLPSQLLRLGRIMQQMGHDPSKTSIKTLFTGGEPAAGIASTPEGGRGITVCTNMNSESSSQLRFVVGDYTVFDTARCACGRTHVRALGGFHGRADDLLNLRGIKFYPSVLEDAVRSVPGVGDEYEVVLDTSQEGIDFMTVLVEHPDYHQPEPVVRAVQNAVSSRIELRVSVEVTPPDTLPKTEFKTKRIKDRRQKS